MDAITKNPGFQHISEDISKLLDKKSLMNCRLVNSSWKKILDEPKFWLKKFHSDSKLERASSISDYDVQRSWKMIAKECNDIDDDFYVPNHDEEKLTAWKNLNDEEKLIFWKILVQELGYDQEVSKEFALLLMKMYQQYQILGFHPLEIVLKLENAKKYPELMKFILEHVNIRCVTILGGPFERISGASPIHVASFLGLTGTVAKLLKKYDSPDIKTKFGGTPLYCATFNGHLETVKFLTGLTFTPNAPDNNGITPLQLAVKRCHPEIVKFMISKVEFLYNPNQTGIITHTLIKEAMKGNQIEIVKSLISKIENPFAPNQNGNTLIHYAVRWSRVEIFKFLASKVKDPNAPNANGDTPLKIAFQMKNRRMFEIILENCQ